MPIYEFTEPDVNGVHSGETWGVIIKYPIEFGDWKLVASNLTLKHKHQYWEIDLERCNSSGEILDWIFHMRGKMTDQDTIDLLAAFACILQPRRHFCSCGIEKHPEGGAKRIVEAYLKQAKA